MKMRHLLPVLLLSAVVVSPVSANWFSNAPWGLNLAIGSAPSPTPDDVRSGRQPMLVRDADGNIIAMIDPSSGKVIATAEPVAPPQPTGNKPAKTAAR